MFFYWYYKYKYLFNYLPGIINIIFYLVAFISYLNLGMGNFYCFGFAPGDGSIDNPIDLTGEESDSSPQPPLVESNKVSQETKQSELNWLRSKRTTATEHYELASRRFQVDPNNTDAEKELETAGRAVDNIQKKIDDVKEKYCLSDSDSDEDEKDNQPLSEDLKTLNHMVADRTLMTKEYEYASKKALSLEKSNSNEEELNKWIKIANSKGQELEDLDSRLKDHCKNTDLKDPADFLNDPDDSD